MDQGPAPRRAQRYHVSWPARVRRGDEGEWHTCRTVNLSVSGVLLRTYREFEVGERVEVEIEFLATIQSKSIISGAGRVVRHDPTVTGGAAILFLSTPSGVSQTALSS
jgi:PilZ domain